MSLSIPTTSALPSFQRIPSTHTSVLKALNRLSRPSLLSLVLDWLDERNQENTAPYLSSSAENIYDFYPAASTLASLRGIYTDLQARKGSKRDVVDRILEGDWREGLSLYQLAMVDMQYLYDHPTSQKWTALKIVPLSEDAPTKSIPRFHPATFLQNLQREVLPDVKVHYNLERHPELSLWILRIYIIDSPYNTSLALQPSQKSAFDTSKIFYVAFPEASPFVYVSLTTSTAAASSAQGSGSLSDNRSLRNLTLEGIPKAFSRPRDRFKLESTSLSARNLEALCEKRGGERTNAAGGGWGIYAEERQTDHPLNIEISSEAPLATDEQDVVKKVDGMKRKIEDDMRVVKRRKMVAQGRFGNSALPDDGKGIERLDIRLEEPFLSTDHHIGQITPVHVSSPGAKKSKGRRSTISLELDRRDDIDEDGEWRPDIRITFHGSHVFAGIRKLVEMGVVDGDKMPGWMTGEEGVSLGVVRDGRIKGNKGSGI